MTVDSTGKVRNDGTGTPLEAGLAKVKNLVLNANGAAALNTDGGVMQTGNLAAAMDSGVYSAAMVAFNIVNRARVEPVLAKAKAGNFGVIAMKVARPVDNNEDRSKLVNGVVAGPLKPQQKAYVWALRNPGLSAVISEMITQQHVDDNLPLAKVT